MRTLLAVLGCEIKAQSPAARWPASATSGCVFAWDRNPAAAESYAAEMSQELKAQRSRRWAPTVTVLQRCDSNRHLHAVAATVASGRRRGFLERSSPASARTARTNTNSHRIYWWAANRGGFSSSAPGSAICINALVAEAMATADVHAELAEVVSGRKPAGATPDEITIFDSTGTALEDVAAAAVVYEKAMALGGHREICLGV